MADSPIDSTVRRWLGEIELAGKDPHQEWVTKAKKVVKRYRDERSDTEQLKNAYRMNILWSNTETMKPAVYANTPVPVVQRRNKDRDPVGRWASIVLERCLSYAVSVYDFDYLMGLVVQDYLLPGRGQLWVEYKPEFEGDYVSFEAVKCCHVHWRDFLTNPARSWDEVWWVAKRDYLTRDEIKKNPLFKDIEVNKPTLDHKPENEPIEDSTAEQFAKATVWTIWSKRDKKVYYIAPGYAGGPLAVTEPPINFDGFFPCPRPIVEASGGDTIIPIPFYCQYQDQAEEIDLLTQRIGLLTKALKVNGVYDAAEGQNGNIEQLLAEGTDNKMIPVDNWAMLSEKGGLSGVVDWFPVENVVAALTSCYAAREQAKQALYEVTGIGDIIRGATDPNETATAQQIKSQWGSLRVRDKQKEIQRFARDVFRLKAEVVAEQFDPETLKSMANVTLLTQAEKQQIQMGMQMAQQAAQQAQAQGMQPPPPPQIPPEKMKAMKEPTWDEVIGLLKNERLRGFYIDVETDSTIQPDENAERENRVQLVTALSQYLPVFGQAVTQYPESAEMMGDMLMFVLRGWKGGEQLEGVVENFVESVKDKASKPPPPPEPTPDAKLKAETDLKKEQMGSQADIQKAQIAAQADLQEAQMDNATEQRGQDQDFQAKVLEFVEKMEQMMQPQEPVQ